MVKAEAVRLDLGNVIDIGAFGGELYAEYAQPREADTLSNAAQEPELSNHAGAYAAGRKTTPHNDTDRTDSPHNDSNRANTPQNDTGRPDTVKNARDEAHEIIRRAQAGAQHIMSEAEAKSRAEIAAAYEKSKAEGYQAGYREGLSEADEAKKTAQAELESAVDEKKRVIGEAEGEIVKLIADISAKLVNGAVLFNPEVVLNLTRQGLAGLSSPGDVTVRVSQADYPRITENREQVVPQGFTSNVEIAADDAMKRGECVIETALGNVDCGIGQQFEGLRNDLYLILNGEK
ncbi:MAG: FliH/SctL family protein [Defluviitaleaceae bacterium]|nr:FliH/SctL family protein [Defluviitaleaceae bacterium]